MWTPRRILMAFCTFIGLGFSYVGYSWVFGSVDGLPPLPKAFANKVTGVPDGAPKIEPLESNPTLRRILDAFGPDCEEKHYPVKIDSRAKGIMILGELLPPEPDGRLQLSPCSLVIFGKQRSPNDPLDISTVHCDRAFIQFDRPVTRLADMEGRKIVSAELRSDPELRWNDPRKGYIHITNNRKSTNPNDGVLMKTVGPMYYVAEPKEGEPHILSDAPLEATDRQNLPPADSEEATVQLPTVTAIGLRLFLATSEGKTPDGKTATNAKKANAAPSISGVERILLLANVTMNLWIDRSSNFLSGNNTETAKETPKVAANPDTPPTPEPRSLLQIHTDGPFQFHMAKDLARFDHALRSNPAIPNYVQVTRHHGKGNLRDMMTSDILEVQFRRQSNDKNAKPVKKTTKTAGSPEPASQQMQVDTIHAWGSSVVLSSDSESLHAWGNDLHHDETNKTTILKGEQVIAVKEGNQIRAKELILAGLDNRETQQARVKGPGQIDLGQVDPKTGKFSYTRQARWEDWLVYSKVKENGETLDVMTLTGGATFVDTFNNQYLGGRQLKVWFKNKASQPLTTDPSKPTPKKSEKKQNSPSRIEATSEVVARSTDLDIQNTDYLNIWFKEQPSRIVPASEIVPPPRVVEIDLPGPKQQPVPAKNEAPATNAIPSKEGKQTPKSNASDKANESKTIAKSPEEAKKQSPPLQVSARKIETWVNVIDGKNELDRVRCEDRVVIHQDPSNPGERGVDINGQKVELNHAEAGNELFVFGSDEELGMVSFDQLTMHGKEIQIDQKNNLANIRHPGRMKILSSTNLQGDFLEKPKEITIDWSTSMEFRGSEKWIRYEGKVQASQEGSNVSCASMQVTLDREVYLNQLDRNKSKAKTAVVVKGKKEESAKVDFVVCDNVPLEKLDQTKQRDEVVMTDEMVRDGLSLRKQRINAPQLTLDNQKSEVIAPGPGVVRVYQPGPKNQGGPTTPAKKDDPKEKAEEEMKLTIVNYSSRMKANNKTRTAIFYGDVDAIHAPGASLEENLDPTALKEGAIRLRCKNKLEVFTQKARKEDGSEVSYQNLNATGNVVVWGEDYNAESDEVKFEEAKDLIIFTGTRERPAIIYKVEVKGQAPKSFKGVKIIYNRRTKDIDVQEGLGVQTN